MAEMSLESIFNPEIIANPYPMYAQLRETAPILPLPDANMVVISTYNNVQDTLKDRQLGHTDDPRMTQAEIDQLMTNPSIATLRRSMLLRNPPDHTRLRGLVVKAFDARRVEQMRARIRGIANELIDGFIQDGSGDLVRAFNFPLPVKVICDMLGIPRGDQGGFVQGDRVTGRLIDPTPMTQEELDGANANISGSIAYFEDLYDKRKADPQDDLITALVQSETEHGKLTRDELTSNVILLFGAGHETTVNLMGNGLLALFRNPEQLELLKAQPELMPQAVDEFLRYDSSVQLSGRGALEDTNIFGTDIAKGTQVITLLAGANRDPAAFERPDEFDITRENSRPLSFGGGIHYCLGAQLARIEVAEALSVLLERLPNLQLQAVDTPEWRQTITLRGVVTMPATW